MVWSPAPISIRNLARARFVWYGEAGSLKLDILLLKYISYCLLEFFFLNYSSTSSLLRPPYSTVDIHTWTCLTIYAGVTWAFPTPLIIGSRRHSAPRSGVLHSDLSGPTANFILRLDWVKASLVHDSVLGIRYPPVQGKVVSLENPGQGHDDDRQLG